MRKTFWNALDPEILERIGSRRDALAEAGRIGRSMAMASVPVALAASTKRAFAQTPQNVVDILNFALTLEYLENEYYIQGLASGVIPAADEGIFATIQAHEQAHVDFLLNQLGNDARSKPQFDFTAGDTFDPFNVYADFTLLAQGFEDTGVRGWIPFDQPGVPTSVSPVYAGEDRVEQLGLNVTEISDVSDEEVTESFDEPLSMQAVLDIAGLFIQS